MAVSMKRSTKTEPESLSTSYLTGSAFMGISMMTLNSSGKLVPAGTRSKLMLGSDLKDMNVKRTQFRPDPRAGRSDVWETSTPGIGALSKYSSSPASPAVAEEGVSGGGGSGARTAAATESLNSSPAKSAALAATG